MADGDEDAFLVELRDEFRYCKRLGVSQALELEIAGGLVVQL